MICSAAPPTKSSSPRRLERRAALCDSGDARARLLGAIGQETSHFTTDEKTERADDGDPGDRALIAGEEAGTINKAYEYSPYFRYAFDGVGNQFKLINSTFYSINFDMRGRF